MSVSAASPDGFRQSSSSPSATSFSRNETVLGVGVVATLLTLFAGFAVLVQMNRAAEPELLGGGAFLSYVESSPAAFNVVDGEPELRINDVMRFFGGVGSPGDLRPVNSRSGAFMVNPAEGVARSFTPAYRPRGTFDEEPDQAEEGAAGSPANSDGLGLVPMALPDFESRFWGVVRSGDDDWLFVVSQSDSAAEWSLMTLDPKRVRANQPTAAIRAAGIVEQAVAVGGDIWLVRRESVDDVDSWRLVHVVGNDPVDGQVVGDGQRGIEGSPSEPGQLATKEVGDLPEGSRIVTGDDGVTLATASALDGRVRFFSNGGGSSSITVDRLTGATGLVAVNGGDGAWFLAQDGTGWFVVHVRPSDRSPRVADIEQSQVAQFLRAAVIGDAIVASDVDGQVWWIPTEQLGTSISIEPTVRAYPVKSGERSAARRIEVERYANRVFVNVASSQLAWMFVPGSDVPIELDKGKVPLVEPANAGQPIRDVNDPSDSSDSEESSAAVPIEENRPANQDPDSTPPSDAQRPPPNDPPRGNSDSPPPSPGENGTGENGTGENGTGENGTGENGTGEVELDECDSVGPAPDKLDIPEVTAFEMTVNWTLPLSPDVTYCSFSVQVIATPSRGGPDGVVSVDTAASPTKLSGLEPETLYEVKVRVKYGASEDYKEKGPIEATTGALGPCEVEGLVASFDDTGYTVTWNLKDQGDSCGKGPSGKRTGVKVEMLDSEDKRVNLASLDSGAVNHRFDYTGSTIGREFRFFVTATNLERDTFSSVRKTEAVTGTRDPRCDLLGEVLRGDVTAGAGPEPTMGLSIAREGNSDELNLAYGKLFPDTGVPLIADFVVNTKPLRQESPAWTSGGGADLSVTDANFAEESVMVEVSLGQDCRRGDSASEDRRIFVFEPIQNEAVLCNPEPDVEVIRLAEDFRWKVEFKEAPQQDCIDSEIVSPSPGVSPACAGAVPGDPQRFVVEPVCLIAPSFVASYTFKRGYGGPGSVTLDTKPDNFVIGEAEFEERKVEGNCTWELVEGSEDDFQWLCVGAAGSVPPGGTLGILAESINDRGPWGNTQPFQPNVCRLTFTPPGSAPGPEGLQEVDSLDGEAQSGLPGRCEFSGFPLAPAVVKPMPIEPAGATEIVGMQVMAALRRFS